MRHYMKGDRVEVLNMTGTLEYSWHPARVVGCHGDVYTVMCDGHATGGVEERVLVKSIRPCPPVVEFSNWCHGDLVHVFDNFAWKLATVLEPLDKKQFLVRIVGSMKNLVVGAAWIRVRHYLQDDHWIVVGKGPSNLDAERPVIHHNKISDTRVEPCNTNVHAARRSSQQKPQNVPTKAVKRSAPSTLDRREARRGLAKISRTAERTSPCTETGMRSKVIEEHQSISRPRRTNAALRGAQHEKHQDSGLSSVGSCSINSNFMNHHYPTQCAEHGCDDDDDELSDAESCNRPNPPQRNQTAGIFVSEKGMLDRPAQRCKLILRFRLHDPLVRGAAL